MNEKRVCTGVLISGLVAILAGGSARVPGAAARPLRADFDNNLAADLAIGVPHETLGSGASARSQAGAVQALYGSQSGGLSSSGSQFWTEDVDMTEGTAESYDFFGYALAVGDFDCLGTPDLAIGLPGQTVNGHVNAGAVHILYSADGSLSTRWDQIFHQDSSGINSLAEDGDYFGWTLAAGDFDADGCDDLAVGVPFEDWNVRDAGIVQVLYGSSSGLTDVGDQLWRQGENGLPNSEGIGDHFGEALTGGDFNGDGYTDLAIGASDEDFDAPLRYGAGVVHVIYGSAGGLTTTGNQYWHQDLAGLLDEAQQYDSFGAALVAGDFDGDGYDELAIGVTGQHVGGDDYAGAVHVLPGSASGLISHGDQLIDQDDLGIGAGYNEHFGRALAASDFDGDGYVDLAVGVPHDDYLSITDMGLVNVLYGSQLGLSTTRFDTWRQGSLYGMADNGEASDQFGYSLAAGDFDGNGYGDLAVGVPYEDIVFNAVNQEDAGAVHVLYGTFDGLTSQGSEFWTQASSGIAGDPEAGDQFGWALAADPRVFHRTFLPLAMQNY